MAATATPLSPLFRTTAGPFGPADGVQSVDVRVREMPLRMVQVAANVAGSHELGLNRATPRITVKDTDTRGVDLQGMEIAETRNFAVQTVFLLAGAANTTFTIEGHL